MSGELFELIAGFSILPLCAILAWVCGGRAGYPRSECWTPGTHAVGGICPLSSS